jgi:hypothetical protein
MQAFQPGKGRILPAPVAGKTAAFAIESTDHLVLRAWQAIPVPPIRNKMLINTATSAIMWQNINTAPIHQNARKR